MIRSAVLSLLVVLAAAGGVALFLLSEPTASPVVAAPTAPLGGAERVAAEPPVALPASAPSGDLPPPPTGGAAGPRDGAPTPEPDAAGDERVRAAVADLAARLEREPLERSDWADAAKVLAGSLSVGADDALRALLAEEPPRGELVAAAQLLALRGAPTGGESGPLPESTLLELRGVLAGLPGDPAAVAAARVLAEGGAPSDVAHLFDLLLADPDDALRGVASWALAGRTPPGTSLTLVRRMFDTGALENADRVLAALQGWSDGPLDVDPATRDALSAAFALPLRDPAGAPADRRTLLALARRIDAELANGLDALCLQDPDLDVVRFVAERVGRHHPDGARLLADELAAAREPARRLVHACALAGRWASLDGAVQAQVATALRETAGADPSRDVRIEAVRALARCGPEERAFVAELEASDPDPAVRAAAREARLRESG